MKRWPGLIIAVLLAAACATDPAPRDHYYSVSVGDGSVHEDVQLQVAIEPVRAAGIHGERPLVVATTDGTLFQHHHHLWAEPPAMMIGDGLLSCLRQRLPAADIRVARGGLRPDATVRTQLRRLARTPATEATPAMARLHLELEIDRRGNGDDRSVSFDREAELSRDHELVDFVHAASGLVTDACDTLARELAAADPAG